METNGQHRPFRFFSSELADRLMEARTLIINEPVTPELAARVSEQLTVLAAESSQPIQLMISHAPGGDAEAALSLYDLMHALTPRMIAIGSGRIGGAGMLVFVGAAGRYGLPHVRFQLEEPRGTLSGQGRDLTAEAEQIADLKQRIVRILSKATGRSEAQVADDLRQRRYLDAEAAVAYGLIQQIVQRADEAD